MKAIYPFLFATIISVVISGCRNQSAGPSDSAMNKNTSVMIDSIIKLDSLASANKISNNALSRSYAYKALTIAKNSNSEEALARAYLIMGFSFRNYNNDSSYIYNSQSLQLAEKIHLQKTSSAAMYNLAMLFYDASDLKTAMVYFDSAVQISMAIQDFRMLSNTYNVLGDIKNDLCDTAGARCMFDSAFQIAKRHSLKMQQGIAIASLSRLEKEPAIRELKHRQAIELMRGIPGVEEEMALIYINLGMYSQNPDSALAFYQEASKLANIIHSSEITIGICNNQAYSYLEKNDWRRAEECLITNAIPLAKREPNYSWLANLYDTYTDVLIAAKKTDEALKYARLAYKTKGLAESNTAPKQVRLLSTLLDVKNKELLLAMNERELRQRESKTRMIIILFSISVLILALVIFFILWRLQRNRLRYHATMLKAAKKIIEAEERERTKIGKDFHDLTGQKFSGLASYLENQEFSKPATKNIALKMLEEIRQAVREMSHRMNRAWVERFTLEESISGLCTDCIKMASLNLEFHAPEKYPEMERETKIHLFRIVQELLANAMQHARSSKITLEISFDGSYLFLRYNDNGPGFDREALNGLGSGLDNIIERVTILGGTVELDTRPEFGTDYSITIPLNRDKNSPTLKYRKP